MFIGRSEAGKTTLTQAMKGNTITYHKTQYVNHYDVIIDTPGEYLQSKNLISALAVFTAEADVIGHFDGCNRNPFPYIHPILHQSVTEKSWVL